MLHAAPPHQVTPVTLAATAAALMLVLAAATVASVASGAPLALSVVFAVASLAVRPATVLYHRRHPAGA